MTARRRSDPPRVVPQRAAVGVRVDALCLRAEEVQTCSSRSADRGTRSVVVAQGRLPATAARTTSPRRTPATGKSGSPRLRGRFGRVQVSRGPGRAVEPYGGLHEPLLELRKRRLQHRAHVVRLGLPKHAFELRQPRDDSVPFSRRHGRSLGNSRRSARLASRRLPRTLGGIGSVHARSPAFGVPSGGGSRRVRGSGDLVLRRRV